MKTLNYARIILLLMITVGLSSCGDEFYNDDFLRNSDEKLCGYVWLEEYVTTDGDLCTHKLEFARTGSGREAFEYRRSSGNSWGAIYKTETYNFNWTWVNDMEGLELHYGANSTLYFDNVWVREYYLSGNFDGVEVTFRR